MPEKDFCLAHDQILLKEKGKEAAKKLASGDHRHLTGDLKPTTPLHSYFRSIPVSWGFLL